MEHLSKRRRRVAPRLPPKMPSSANHNRGSSARGRSTARGRTVRVGRSARSSTTMGVRVASVESMTTRSGVRRDCVVIGPTRSAGGAWSMTSCAQTTDTKARPTAAVPAVAPAMSEESAFQPISFPRGTATPEPSHSGWQWVAKMVLIGRPGNFSCSLSLAPEPIQPTTSPSPKLACRTIMPT